MIPFSWINPKAEILQGLDRRFLVKIVAKTPRSTDHTKDLSSSDRTVRIYTEKELHEAARSLALRYINVNHDNKLMIQGAFVVDAEFNPPNVEALAYIPSLEYIQKLKEGIIKNVSVEEFNREDVSTPKGTELKGLVFSGLALVDPSIAPGIQAGDQATSLRMYESLSILCEVIKVEAYEGVACSPELRACVDDLLQQGQDEQSAFAICRSKIGEVKKEWTWDACIAKMQSEGYDDKTAAAICGKIKNEVPKVESVPAKEPVIEPKIPETVLSPPDNSEKRIKELEEAVSRLQKTVADADKTKSAEVEKAKQETKEAIIKKVSEAIPSVLVTRQGSVPFNRLVMDIKKKLNECVNIDY